MSRIISLADFVGQEEQDGVNRNTSRVQHENKTKKIFCKFVTYILQLSNEEPKPVDGIILTFIQELVDAKIEPEIFFKRVQELLNIIPQTCLIVFVKNSLPFLKKSLFLQEIVIEGIRPPQINAVNQPTLVFSNTQKKH